MENTKESTKLPYEEFGREARIELIKFNQGILMSLVMMITLIIVRLIEKKYPFLTEPDPVTGEVLCIGPLWVVAAAFLIGFIIVKIMKWYKYYSLWAIRQRNKKILEIALKTKRIFKEDGYKKACDEGRENSYLIHALVAERKEAKDDENKES